MRQLEIGPGPHPLGDGWETLDCISKPAETRRVGEDHYGVWGEERLRFPDATFDTIYASHVLEHVPWNKTVTALKEAHRILTPGGRLEIWVPDGSKIIQAWVDNAPERDGWWRDNPQHDPDIWLNGRLFTHGPGLENFHRALFTRRLLHSRLLEAGFRQTGDLTEPRGYDHGFINMGVVGFK